jgi:hypothetical protein
VLEIHEQQSKRYGGSPGLRDAAGLESAVATPQATFGGEFLHTSILARPRAEDLTHHNVLPFSFEPPVEILFKRVPLVESEHAIML